MASGLAQGIALNQGAWWHFHSSSGLFTGDLLTVIILEIDTHVMHD